MPVLSDPVRAVPVVVLNNTPAVEGVVIPGDRRGRQLGFPTANEKLWIKLFTWRQEQVARAFAHESADKLSRNTALSLARELGLVEGTLGNWVG